MIESPTYFNHLRKFKIKLGWKYAPGIHTESYCEEKQICSLETRKWSGLNFLIFQLDLKVNYSITYTNERFEFSSGASLFILLFYSFESLFFFIYCHFFLIEFFYCLIRLNKVWNYIRKKN